MRFLRTICRLIFGLTFIFSGIVKLLSPLGTSLIFKEYFAAMHLGALDGTALFIGMLLAVTEFTLGICILLAVRIKITSTVALCLSAFFTLLTLYLAIFNPISDCGCFGEAIHLTNWQTFLKNLILLPCIFLLFMQRKKIALIASPAVEWAFLGFFAAAGLALWIHSFYYVPIWEFTPYRIGSLVACEDESDYNTTFLYQKDGKVESFDLENLPDSTWTFYDSITEMTSEGSQYSDFMFFDQNENDITDQLLSSQMSVLISIYDPAKLSEDKWNKIADFSQQVKNFGGELIVASSIVNEAIPEYFQQEVAFADKRLLMTINRSNGGATLFSDGYVAEKWSITEMSDGLSDEMFEEDGESMVIKNSIKEHIIGSILIVCILISLVLIYYICKLSFKHNKKNETK